MEDKVVSNQVQVLTAEILILKDQTAANIIEIGKRLINAKEILPHGEWGKWLQEKVEFSQYTAARFMRAAREFGNLPSMANLGTAKVFALLDIPEKERVSILQEPQIIPSIGEAKTIGEMSTRQLAEVKKALNDADEARASLTKAQSQLAEMEQKAKEAESSRSALEERLAKLSKDSSQEMVSELKSQLEKAQKATAEKEAEAKKLRDAIAGLENRLRGLDAKEPQVIERLIEVEKIVEVESPGLKEELDTVKQELMKKEKDLQELLEKQAKVKDFETQVNKLSGEIAILLETKRKLEEANDEQERVRKRALEFHAALRRVMRPLQEEWGNLEFLLKQCNINAIDATEVLAYVDQLRKIADTLGFHLTKAEGCFVTLSKSGVPHLDRKSFEGVTVDVQPVRVGRS